MRISVPKKAAAVILIKNHGQQNIEFFWAKRAEHLPFMGGYQAFPGGQVDESDSEINILNLPPGADPAVYVCAVREVFEETTLLLTHGAENISLKEKLSAHKAMENKQLCFNDFLKQNGLQIDANYLIPSGNWVTPQYAARRFDTYFFASVNFTDQEIYLCANELNDGKWIRPDIALKSWADTHITLAPPTLHAVRSLDQWDKLGVTRSSENLTEILLETPHANGEQVEVIEIRPGIWSFPLRTPTLPPATHTNCFIIGEKDLIVIDPASPYEDEQHRLNQYIENLKRKGSTVREIWLTHHHPDHIGGALQASERWNVPIAAHPITANLLSGKLEVHRLINDGELIELQGIPGWKLRSVFTPGHAPGHLCFLEERSGSLITGDMVIGLGSVLISPPDGNMQQYLDSLHKLLTLNSKMILGGHGQALINPQRQINSYIKHRLDREQKILDAINSGATTISEIVKIVYTKTPAELLPFAGQSVLAHLEKLCAENKVKQISDQSWVSSV